MDKILKNRYLILWIILIPCAIFSQDNHNYLTPLGKSLYYKEVQDANRMILSMSEISPISKGNDGLTVVFSMQQDFSKVTRPLKLLSFTVDTEENSYIDIFYDDSSITIRRKFRPGSSYYYVYNLYDPMFTVDSGVTKWEVHLFFTGYFFWIETRNVNKLMENKWHAPIFFGINLPGIDYMSNYLGRQSDAKLVFGDANPSTAFSMPDEVEIREFKYTELKDELQNNFCNTKE